MSDAILTLTLDYSGGARVLIREQTRKLVKCECGLYRWDDALPHSPRINGDRLVDCMGRDLR